jgi:hypothetical protein
MDTTEFNGKKYTMQAGKDGVITLIPEKQELKQGQVWEDSYGQIWIIDDQIQGVKIRMAENESAGFRTGEEFWLYGKTYIGMAEDVISINK